MQYWQSVVSDTSLTVTQHVLQFFTFSALAGIMFSLTSSGIGQAFGFSLNNVQARISYPSATIFSPLKKYLRRTSGYFFPLEEAASFLAELALNELLKKITSNIHIKQSSPLQMGGLNITTSLYSWPASISIDGKMDPKNKPIIIQLCIHFPIQKKKPPKWQLVLQLFPVIGS